MKLNLKVFVLLASMLFSAVGASAQIAEGTYYLKHNDSEMYVKYDVMGELTDKANASKIEVKHLSSSYYTFRLIEEDNYLCSNGAYPDFQTDSYAFEVNGTQESFSLHCSEGYLINLWDFLDFGSDAEYWSLESAGSSTPETPAYMELSENTIYYLGGNGLYLEPNNSISADYETGDLANNNAIISGSKSQFGMWSIETVVGQDYVYLRNLSSKAYLGKATGALQLVKDESEAGKYYIFEDGSIQDSETNQYIAVTGDKLSGTELSISSTKGTWTVTEATDYTMTLSLNSYGYATTCMPFNFTCAGGRIYAVRELRQGVMLLNETIVAKAGEGYILQGEPNATITLAISSDDADANAESILTGTLIRQTYVYTTIGDYYFALNNEGFRRASSEAVPANRAILIPEQGTLVSAFAFNFGGDIATGIEALRPTTSTTGTATYDLQGRTARSAAHGMYIMNGSKVIR